MSSEVSQLRSRAKALFAEFEQGGAIGHLDEAIDLDREALELCPNGHPMRSVALNLLAIHLRARYSRVEVTNDLDEAVLLDREALDLRQRGHPCRFESLYNLALCLSTRYNQLGVIQHLDEAIFLGREALNVLPKDHPDRSQSLNNIAGDLSTRYDELGDMQDLEEAIALYREALDLQPKGHPNHSTTLNSLAVGLSTRYDQLGVMQDLDEAIVLDREALALRPKGHPGRSASLSNLAVDLGTRYQQLGDMQDLHEAILLDREAVDLEPKGHHHRSVSLGNLAVHLSTRYDQLGVMQDLDEAIVLDREALDLRPDGHPDRFRPLINHAAHLFTRYNQLEAMQDLDEAIALGRQALDLLREGHPDRSTSLNNLATHLSTRYSQLGAVQDLDGAIVLGREALELRPTGHPNRSMSLYNLAGHLSTRYDQFGAIQDLDEAIVLNREAVDLRPEGHPDRFKSLNNLAVDLCGRYNHLGVMQDLDEAIVLGREALHLLQNGHPQRSTSLENLARRLRTRFTQSGNFGDKEELFNLYTQLAHVPQLASSADLSAARAWIRVAEEFQHPTLLLAYETALLLLIQHLAALPSLPQHHVVLKRLSSSLAVDAFSACLRNRVPAHAVELLEQGRSVFWTQLTRLYTPLHDVMESGPAGKTMADKFTQLALDIRNALNTPGADQHERLWHLNLKMQEVVTNIRELPGLSRFLLPSLFSDLQCAARGGPVVILNASKYSCDALVVFFDRDPVHIPLQITQGDVRNLSAELHTLTVRSKRLDVTSVLASFLRKLWDYILSPVVDCLQKNQPSASRIWWCPTGEFTALPFHAAGPYRKGQRNLAELYVSSYTPTLTALIRARSCDPSHSKADRKRFVAIGQAAAVGQSELPSVALELDKVGQRVRPLTSFTRIDGTESCISRVVEELGRNEWVHLACHGLANPTRPFESAFALHNGHFTIQRIIGCDMWNPEFAYLSACHTTVGDEESPDEVIHLAAAMQFVGFRSVIGTMWAVDDGETNKITWTFYGHMVDDSGRLDYARAAFALNKTMQSVRVPLDQRILYIHLGA